MVVGSNPYAVNDTCEINKIEYALIGFKESFLHSWVDSEIKFYEIGTNKER